MRAGLAGVLVLGALAASCGRSDDARAARTPERVGTLAARAPEVLEILRRADDAYVLVFAEGTPVFTSVLETGARAEERILGRKVSGRGASLASESRIAVLRLLESGSDVARFDGGFEVSSWRALLVRSGERALLVMLHRSEPRLRIAVGIGEMWDLQVSDGAGRDARNCFEDPRGG